MMKSGAKKIAKEKVISIFPKKKKYFSDASRKLHLL